MNRSTVLIVSATLLSGGMLAGIPGPNTLAAATVANTTADPVNKVCPIKGNEVDKESPTRQFKAVTIGFCCPGCEGKWDAKSDEEKMALLVKHAPEAVTAIQSPAPPAPAFIGKDYKIDAGTLQSNPALVAARGYLAACAKADAKALDAWIAYHAGRFEEAATLGLAAGGSGLNAANKAACIYANYLEDDEAKKLTIYQEVNARCETMQADDPKNANAFYLQAYALGRYAQGISIVKALKDGVGTKVQKALSTAIKLNAKHADAHIGLGSYHAEIIDKVGALVGGLTYGAKKEIGVSMFEQALKLNPASAIARIEYANGLVMLFGKGKMTQAETLYNEAAAHAAKDAMERLDVELAKSEMED